MEVGRNADQQENVLKRRFRYPRYVPSPYWLQRADG